MGLHGQHLRDSILIRAGKDFKYFGDPFSLVLTVEILPNFTAHLIAAHGRFYPGFRREVLEYLYELGFKYVKWERNNSLGVKRKEILFNIPELLNKQYNLMSNRQEQCI